MKVEVVTAEILVEDTIKETVSVICICSPCLIQTSAINKDVVYCRRALTRKKIPPTIFFYQVPFVCVNRQMQKNGARAEGGGSIVMSTMSLDIVFV